MPPPRLIHSARESSAPNFASISDSIRSNRAKSLFSQLLWIMKPLMRSMAVSILVASHSPSRLKGRAGSARSKLDELMPGLRRRPRAMPDALSAKRSSWPIELKMILSAWPITASISLSP
ncbi:hypothetical protein D3C87_1630400 [compost metagenome]